MNIGPQLINGSLPFNDHIPTSRLLHVVSYASIPLMADTFSLNVVGLNLLDSLIVLL